MVLLNVCIGLGAWTIRRAHFTLGIWLLLFQSVLIFLIVVVLMLLGARSLRKRKNNHERRLY